MWSLPVSQRYSRLRPTWTARPNLERLRIVPRIVVVVVVVVVAVVVVPSQAWTGSRWRVPTARFAK